MKMPLDVGVFSTLATAWSDHCTMILEETREGMELWYVVEEYMKAQEKAFKKETILQAWCKAGINPAQTDSFQESDITLEIFTERDFTPSYSTSTQVKGVCQSTRLPCAPDASSNNFVPADAPNEESEDEGSEDEWKRPLMVASDTDLETETETGMESNNHNQIIHQTNTHALTLTTSAMACSNTGYLPHSPSTPIPSGLGPHQLCT
ncbi:hypothetical protein C0989_010429 [Termitomyces sp. Mn162]|nr:hypothetical protein C0989_010429 [Termitomyces sp. Mn162]